MTKRRKQGIVLVGLAAVLAAGLTAMVIRSDSESGSRDGEASASPEEIRTGAALMQALDCDGKPLVVSDGVNDHVVSGSGFLVGSRVLMGVEHMIPPQPGLICGFRARLDGRWYDVSEVKIWSERGEEDRRGIDLATALLVEDAPGHIFRFAEQSPPVGAKLTLLGHPLGGDLRASAVTVTRRLMDYGKPTLAAKIAPSIQGGDSGGPIVNDRGEVVSVLSRTVITANLTADGSARYGGVDIARWWGDAVRSDLCRAYPDGGIPDCDSATNEAKKAPIDVSLKGK